jgi:putative inorganic carbon (HCO3(-)) transporter
MHSRAIGRELPLPPGNDSVSPARRVEARPSGSYQGVRSRGANALVVVLLSPFALLTTGWVQRVLLGIVVLDIPFQFGTHFFYREYDSDRGALGGLSVSVSTVALAGLYVAWFVSSLVNRDREARTSLRFSVPLVIYFAVTALSVVVAEDSGLALFQVFLLLETCLLYFYVANNVRTRKDALFVISTLLVGCLLESAVIVVMKFTVTQATSWNLPIHLHGAVGKEGLLRSGGTIGTPNTAAAYLSLLLAPAASLLFVNLGRTYRLLAGAVLLLGGIALILTFSRGGWIAFALAAIALCLFVWRRRGLSLRTPIAIVVVVALLLLPFQSLISQRLLGDDKGSAESRIPLIRLALRITADHPFLGVGANNFTIVMDRYLTAEFRSGFLYAVHNTFLLILAETGIFGLLAYLAFLLGTLRAGWQCWKFNDGFFSVIALGFAAGLAGHMVQMSVDIFNDSPIAHLVLLIAGLVVAMQRICVAEQHSGALSARA